LDDPGLRRALARSIGRRIDVDDVDDVVQSTLAEALASKSLPASCEERRRFVFAIARQKIADAYRRRRVRTLPSDGAEEPHVPSADLLRWAERALPPQPDAKRTLGWMLREGEGETLAEIAAADRVPAATVRQRVSRMRRYFRARWTKELVALGLLGIVAFALALAARHSRENIVREESAPLSSAAVAPSAPSATPQPPRAPVAPPAPTAESVFDRKEAARALAAIDVQGCATATSASAPSHAVVTFAPDGSVASVRFDSGPLVSAPERACVEARLSRARVKPFAGDAVAVGKSVALVPPPGSPSRGFDAPAAERAIRALDFRSCLAGGATSAQGSIVVSFSPDGSAPVARAGWPNADAAERACITRILMTARAPAFSSNTVIMRATFSIEAGVLSWTGPFTVTGNAPPAPNCDVPYVIDASGRKHYKLECLR
jgi:DNA-directed RNA polymerase specialized sigma24 family protein